MAHLGGAEKRVPNCSGRPRTGRPADGGQGHFLNGGLMGHSGQGGGHDFNRVGSVPLCFRELSWHADLDFRLARPGGNGTGSPDGAGTLGHRVEAQAPADGQCSQL
jgi:hypothetical protein